MEQLIVDANYKLEKKKNNGLLYALFWHLGFLFAHLFRQLGVSPNVVSIFSLFFYILTAAMLTMDGYYNHLIASLAFFFGVLMDCTDGKLARLTGSTSLLGVWLDTNFDYLKPIFLYGPMALSLYRSDGSILHILLGFGAIQFSLLFTIITMKWSTFSFAQGVKRSYTANSRFHPILKQLYFIEGFESVFFILAAVFSRLDLFLITWTIYLVTIYLVATVRMGIEIAKH